MAYMRLRNIGIREKRQTARCGHSDTYLHASWQSLLTFRVAEPRVAGDSDCSNMPVHQRYEEVMNAFKAEMQEYVNEGFSANDCFPFVFENLVDTTGVPSADRAELRREMAEWTRKII